MNTHSTSLAHRPRLRAILALTAGMLTLASARADFLSFTLPGAAIYDGWTNLTASGNPGYPGFPGSAPWPGPIGSNEPGSGDAGYTKLSGMAYPASSSVYAFGPASFSVGDTSPLASLETVVFQVRIGGGETAGLNGAPTLSLNGGLFSLEPDYSQVVFSGPATVGGFEVTLSDLAYQWDLSSFNDPITSFEILYSVGAHAQTYALQLDQSESFAQVVAVPEPAHSAAAISLTLLGLLALRRKRRPINPTAL